MVSRKLTVTTIHACISSKVLMEQRGRGGDAYVYSPPDDGIAVPSSAYEIAPRSAMMPARTHACKKCGGVVWCKSGAGLVVFLEEAGGRRGG